METQRIFDLNTLYLFIGGIFSIFLPVIIIIGKQGFKRGEKRKELEKNNQVGDIEQWLDESYEYKRPHFLKLMTEWSLQPLFIISITNLISHSGFLESLITFLLTLMIFLHELWMSERHSNKLWYQGLMLLIWFIVFCIINIGD